MRARRGSGAWISESNQCGSASRPRDCPEPIAASNVGSRRPYVRPSRRRARQACLPRVVATSNGAEAFSRSEYALRSIAIRGIIAMRGKFCRTMIMRQLPGQTGNNLALASAPSTGFRTRILDRTTF